MNPQRPGTDETIAQTEHLRLMKRDGWSFVQRVGSKGVVGIVATTDGGCLLLVEQHRPPLDAPAIELPAGLAGDLDEQPDEPLLQAAQRELLEETGYTADHWHQLPTLASSAGLTDEAVAMFRARGLRKQSGGGGDASEDIGVHEIPLQKVESWLAEAAAAGKAIDSRVYAALYFLSEHGNHVGRSGTLT